MQRGKCKVVADVVKNRLYVVLQGSLSAAEIRAVAGQVTDQMNRLRPGFDVVTDLSAANGTDTEGLEELTRLQGYVATHGMRRAVRVVPQAFVAMLQMWRTSRQFGYSVDLALSITEAQKILDDPRARSADVPQM